MGIHLAGGEHAEILELVELEEVGFITDKKHPAAAFGLGAGESVGNLGNQG